MDYITHYLRMPQMVCVCACMHAYQGTMGVDLRYPEGVLLSLAMVINQNAMSSRECWHACKYSVKYIVCVSLSACVLCKASSAEMYECMHTCASSHLCPLD